MILESMSSEMKKLKEDWIQNGQKNVNEKMGKVQEESERIRIERKK